MTFEEIFRDVLVWGSAASIGAALFTAVLCLRMWKQNPRRYSGFAAAKIGYALTIGTVLVRILMPARELPGDAYSWAYALGLFCAAYGFTSVGRTIRREFVNYEEDHGKFAAPQQDPTK